MVQKERDEILNATCEDIRALASQIRAVLDQQNLCVDRKRAEDQREQGAV